MKIELPFNDMLASFRMPFYFLLSGLFFKPYNSFGEFIIKKTNRLLIPFVFFYLTITILWQLIFKVLMSLCMTSQKNSILGVLESMKVNFISDHFFNGPIWFLLCLFFMNILFYMLYRISVKSKYNILFLCILSFSVGFIGFYLGKHNIYLPLYIGTAMSCLPFFMIGYFVRKYTNILIRRTYDKYLWIISIALFAYIYKNAKYVFFFTNDLTEVNLISFYLCGLLGTFAILFISKGIERVQLISYLGKYSIMVLCTHSVIIEAFRMVYYHYMMNKYKAGILLFILIVLTETVIIIPFCKRYLPYVTAQKDVIK